MIKALIRWYLSFRVTGDEEIGYSATWRGKTLWAADRDNLLDVLCGRVKPH